MAKLKSLRYIVTGPGLDANNPPSYADPGPALSRSLTAAERSQVEGTWYATDAITDQNIGYSEVTINGKTRTTTTVRR